MENEIKQLMERIIQYMSTVNQWDTKQLNALQAHYQNMEMTLHSLQTLKKTYNIS